MWTFRCTSATLYFQVFQTYFVLHLQYCVREVEYQHTLFVIHIGICTVNLSLDGGKKSRITLSGTDPDVGWAYVQYPLKSYAVYSHLYNIKRGMCRQTTAVQNGAIDVCCGTKCHKALITSLIIAVTA